LEAYSAPTSVMYRGPTTTVCGGGFVSVT
jgi:hypothetical protein